MTNQEKIKALAELDGWICDDQGYWSNRLDEYGQIKSYPLGGLHPNWLTSYDAIIPLIQKQPEEIRSKVRDILDSRCYVFDAPIDELVDALLIATGKMI